MGKFIYATKVFFDGDIRDLFGVEDGLVIIGGLLLLLFCGSYHVVKE